MVLSSWQSHCESSPGSFDECRLSSEVAANPQTKPTDLDCESARKKWHLPSASTIAIYYYSARDLIPTDGGRLSRPRHCSKGVQPVPKAVYRSGCRDIKQLLAVRFEPGSSHTAVRHVTARPLRHCKLPVIIQLHVLTYNWTRVMQLANTPPLQSGRLKMREWK